jgi:murein DD-endopeptidase MepM/ murein hydrolase activator NlpD
MRARLGRAAIAGVILATLLIPAVGSVAGTRHDLNKTQHKLRKLHARISNESNNAHSARAHVDALSRKIADLQMAINRFDNQIAKLKTKVTDAQARIDASQLQIDKLKSVATAQAVALYENGTTDTLAVLLDSESLGQLDMRLEMMGAAAKANTGSLIKYGRLEEQVRAEHRQVFNEEARLRDQVHARAGIMTQVKQQRSQLHAQLHQLNGKLGTDRNREADLTKQSLAIQQKILEKTTLHSVAVLGKSAEGFIWPLNGAINSPYGYRSFDGSFHPGIDIDGYEGEPFVAPKAGVVISAGWMDGYGNLTVIDHGGGIETAYGHQSRFGVHAGERVRQGQVIGYVGCTGYCTGPHLHFEVRVNGKPVNPMGYLP